MAVLAPKSSNDLVSGKFHQRIIKSFAGAVVIIDVAIHPSARHFTSATAEYE